MIITSDYKISILIVYKENTDDYKELIHNYVQSLHVNVDVKAVSHKDFGSEDLKKYDLIYPDVSLVNTTNSEEIVNTLTNYVQDGGNLFIEECLYAIFPKEVLGMTVICPEPGTFHAATARCTFPAWT